MDLTGDSFNHHCPAVLLFFTTFSSCPLHLITEGASCPQANCQRHMLINIRDHVKAIYDRWIHSYRCKKEDIWCCIKLYNVINYITNKLICRLFSLKDSGEYEQKELPRTEKEDHHQSEDDEQQLSEDTKDLRSRLDKERRRSYTFELQVHPFITYRSYHHYT